MPVPLKFTNRTWDVFVPAHPCGSLREIALLAAQLSRDPSIRVRVFVDDPARFRGLNSRLDESLWVQPLSDYELWKLRLSNAVVPASNVLCFSGNEPPRRYRERMVYGVGAGRRLFHIWPPGSTLPQNARSRGANTSFMTLDVVQDEKTPHIGVIKDPRNSSELRERWRAHPGVIQVTLKSLGFSGRLDRNTLIVCCWGAAIPDQIGLVRELARSSMQSLLLLVGPDADGKLMDVQAMSVWDDASQPLLQCFPLPLLTWSQMDEVVWSSDLIYCGVRDIAQRAMESATPMIWLPPGEHPRAGGDDGLLDWYCEGIDPGFKRSVLAVARGADDRDAMAQVLAWQMGRRNDLLQIARHVARRLANAKQFADAMPDISPASIEQDTALPPRPSSYMQTWPMEFPDGSGHS